MKWNQWKKRACISLFACLMAVSLTACGDSTQQAGSSTPEVGTDGSSATITSEPVNPSSETPEPESSSNLPPVAPESSEPIASEVVPATEDASSTVAEVKNELVVNFRDHGGDDVAVKIFPQTLTTPEGTFDLTSSAGMDAPEVKAYLSDYQQEKSAVSFSMGKSCKIVLHYALEDESNFDFTEAIATQFAHPTSHYMIVEFSTDGGASTNCVYANVIDSQTAGIVNAKLNVEAETFLE